MLESHRIDVQIVEAIVTLRDGGTVADIQSVTAELEPVSIDTIKRHIPGLVRLGVIRGENLFRDERLVTVWDLTSHSSQQT